jgi:ribosomal protein S17
MKSYLLALLLVIPFQLSHAKFAASAFKMPCHEMEIKISSCEGKDVKGSDLRKRYRKNVKDPSVQGAFIQGEVLSDKAVQCHTGQKMDTSKFRSKEKQKKKFFVIQGSCLKLKVGSTTKVTNLRSFCDTPGAMEINECFYSALARRFQSIIVK